MHLYSAKLEWTGANGQGTKNYQSYERSYKVLSAGKPVLQGSSDPMFRGDPSKYNPEDMLLISLSACHMLWYLHLCSAHSVLVLAYEDSPVGEMIIDKTGSGRFQNVILNPKIKIADMKNFALAMTLHKDAHTHCFIANSVNFQVTCSPEVTT